MKRFIKKMITRTLCLVYQIPYTKGLYIGPGSKIVGGANVRLSESTQIMPNVMLCSNGGIIKIGKGSEIGMYSRIASVREVQVGNNVITGPHIFIADYNHEYSNPNVSIKFQGNKVVLRQANEPLVSIGDGTWLGTNVVIAGSFHIGKNCIIGANSVVTHDIPDYSVAVGIPAKVIKTYDFEKNEWIKIN